MNIDHTKVTEMSAEQQTAIVDVKEVLAKKAEILVLAGRAQAFGLIKK